MVNVEHLRWEGSVDGPLATMTVEEAALFVALYSRPAASRIESLELAGQLAERAGLPDEHRRHLVRTAAKRLHPDRNGDLDLFRRLLEARGVLDRARRA